MTKIAVSITMPTYKRPDLLPRAVQSVLQQTFTDWELIITDDEDPSGATWCYLETLAEQDRRIRPLRNPGPHGQVGNNNFALKQARGRWIKPLFDDDALKPDCLTRMMAAVQSCPEAILVSCLADIYINGRLKRPGRRGLRAPLERLESEQALLACYLHDLDIGTPVQVMFQRTVIEAGILWESTENLTTAQDTWWLYRVMSMGQTLLLNAPLIDQHWGHHNITALVQADPVLLDGELRVLKTLLYPMLAPDLNHPPLLTILDALDFIRAILRIRDRRLLDALGLMFGARRLGALPIALSWLSNKLLPGLKPLVSRTPVFVQAPR